MASQSNSVVQIIASDADLHIRREAELLDLLIRDWGWESSIRVLNPTTSERINGLKPKDILLLHFDGSPFPSNISAHPADRIALILHDYIQETFYPFYADEHKESIISAGEQLKTLVANAELCIGHSEKAIKILEDLGAARVRLVPLFFDFRVVQEMDDPFTAKDFSSEFRLLHTGENDCEAGLPDLLKTLWYLREFISDKSANWCLYNAGRFDRCEGSMVPIQQAMEQYNIPQDWLLMASNLDEHQLDTAFRHARLYASFDRGDLDGAGMIQSIASGVPAIAVVEGAGATVLGNSPLLFDEPVHSAVAESIDRLLRDKTFLDKVLSEQESRLRLFDHTAVAFTLRSLFSRFNASS